MEEEVTLGEIIEELFERQTALELALEGVSQMQREIWIDHQALFRLLRNSGRFSKDMWIRVRREIADRMEEEEDGPEEKE